MGQIRWDEGKVVSLRLKDGSFVLAQLLKSPFMVFFWAFADSDEWDASAAENARPMVFCSVTRQFLKYSVLTAKPDVRRAALEKLPTLWIAPFHGSRRVTIWPGTPRERSFLDLSDRPGGQLIEKHMDASGVGHWPVIVGSIPLNDTATIDGHEANVVWIYPHLNERLFLSKTLGRVVDPDKDIMFDRPISPDYATYIDMRARHGTLEDWGYSSTSPNETREKKPPRAKKR